MREGETSMKAFRVRLWATVGVSVLLAQYAGAEPSPADKSLATSLFKEGRALVDQGHVSEGCRKLEESQRLDPGGGTLLNLALCHEKEGRTATAWAEFTEALGIAKRDDRPQRAEFARTHIAQLEMSLSRLIILVPYAAETPDLEIKRDGSMIGRAAWGSPMPVDPGDHLVEAYAPGKAIWKETVSVGPKGDSKTLTVPPLENAPPPTSTGAGGLPTSPGAPSMGAPFGDGTAGASFDASSGGAGPTLGGRSTGPSPAAWVALGLGVAAAGAGTYFALHAISLKSDADRDCPRDACVGNGAQENSDAIKSANLATAGLAVGLVGIGFGTYLLFATTGPRRTAALTGDRGTVSIDTAGFSIPRGGGAEFVMSGRY
jgi:hypothetical protein